MTSDPEDLGAAGAKRLGLSPEVAKKLTEIQAEVSGAYRDTLIEMMQALNRQASALERIQRTLEILIEHTAPQLKGQAPAAFRVAADGESPDVASALVVADPIAAGYTMTQADLARALGISGPDASILARAFKLEEDPDCAVVVRGGKNKTVNYHPRAARRFRELVAKPPRGISTRAEKTAERVRRKLLLADSE